MPNLYHEPDLSVRRPDEVAAAIGMLRQFTDAGYSIFPLKVLSKAPRHFRWQARDYSDFDFSEWLRIGGNVGIRLSASDVVLDCDPRNYDAGDDPLRRLSVAVGTDLSNAPRVITGSGGRHYFWAKPADVRIVSKLPDYPGLDIKSGGGLVVAAGSIHPDTGETYRLDPASPPPSLVDHVPPALLDMVRRPDRSARNGAGGEITPEQLGVLLTALDPRKFGRGRYEEWIRLAAACHDATNGDGLEEWLAWCARDPDYGAQVTERNVVTWESFTAGRPAGATYKTLLAAVVAAGRRDLVARLGITDEDLFEADPGFEYEMDEVAADEDDDVLPAEPGVTYELDDEEAADG